MTDILRQLKHSGFWVQRCLRWGPLRDISVPFHAITFSRESLDVDAISIAWRSGNPRHSRFGSSNNQSCVKVHGDGCEHPVLQPS